LKVLCAVTVVSALSVASANATPVTSATTAAKRTNAPKIVTCTAYVSTKNVSATQGFLVNFANAGSLALERPNAWTVASV
jgi:hypothetical protein